MIKEFGEMGYPKRRIGKDGKPRYTAVYVDLRGSERSAGTFASEKAANRAWQQAEVELRQGRVGDPTRGRQSFRGTSKRSGSPTMYSSPPPVRSTLITSAHISSQDWAP
jgi:hypothetical protein